jgi:DNA-binding transcriptional regulator YiaG
VRKISAIRIVTRLRFEENSCYKKRMVTKNQTLQAIAALKAGDLPKAVGVAAKAVEIDLPLVKEALQTGFALGQASHKGETPSADAIGFLRFLAAAPVAAEGFRSLRAGLGISQAEIARMCGVSRAVVSDWERGKASLPPAAVHALLGLTMARLDSVERPPLLGRDIARIRKAIGMRQTDFAAALGVSEIAVRKWEQYSDKPLAASTVRRIQPRLDELEARASAAS